MGNNVESLIFGIESSTGMSHFCFNALYVKEIIQPPALTKLPTSCPYFKGMFELRGEVIPVFDLPLKLFNHEGKASTVIIMLIDNKPVAFKVDDVISVENLEIEPFESNSTKALIGFSKQPDRLIQYLDPKYLVDNINEIIDLMSSTQAMEA